MLRDIPSDVLRDIGSFLTNDGVSIGRLSLCSKSLYERLAFESSRLWRKLLEEQFSYPTGSICGSDIRDARRPDPYRQEYVRQYEIDRKVARILDKLCEDLSTTLGLSEQGEEDDGNEGFHRIDGNELVGQAWDHPLWKELSVSRSDVVDALRRAARSGRRAGTTRVRLRAFLAARTLQNIEFAECLYEWKSIHQLQEVNTVRMATDPSFNSLLLERYTLLVNHIQQTPDQLLLQDRDIKRSIVERLDQLATDCRGRMDEDMGIMERVQFVNKFMVEEQGFTGNSDDYYNYRNSLLDCVLDSKKGIPITLAILYTCVCRRLDLNVHLVGLPGHVVLGFRTETNALRLLDVFRGGRVLDAMDCRRICNSYGVAWDADFLKPLSAQHVLQRILNNLANCHFHGLASRAEPFHADLFFNQRALASIHRQPPGAAAPLVDRVNQELPLTLSPDLLRYYGLLSPAPRPQDLRGLEDTVD